MVIGNDSAGGNGIGISGLAVALEFEHIQILGEDIFRHTFITGTNGCRTIGDTILEVFVFNIDTIAVGDNVALRNVGRIGITAGDSGRIQV